MAKLAARSLACVTNPKHFYALCDLGVQLTERKNFESALMTARSVLEALGWQPHQSRTLAMRFRRHDITQINAMAPRLKD